MTAQIFGAFYLLTFVGALAATALSITMIVRPSLARFGLAVTAGAAGAGLAALAARSVLSGHLPIFGTFENTLMAAWFLLAAACLAPLLWPVTGTAWRWAAPWALVLLLYGVSFRREPLPLTISERSLWVDAHVVFAWLAFTALLGASTLSALELLGRRPLGVDREAAERVLTRLLAMGFLAFTVMLILGSYYLYVLFATFWRWEVVETFSLLAWLGYGMILHARLFYRWSGIPLHLAVVGLLPVLVAAYWIWSVFPGTFHFFDVPLVRPY